MEIIGDSNKGFQDEVDSLNESLQAYVNSLINYQCFFSPLNLYELEKYE